MVGSHASEGIGLLLEVNAIEKAQNLPSPMLLHRLSEGDVAHIRRPSSHLQKSVLKV